SRYREEPPPVRRRAPAGFQGCSRGRTKEGSRAAAASEAGKLPRRAPTIGSPNDLARASPLERSFVEIPRVATAQNAIVRRQLLRKPRLQAVALREPLLSLPPRPSFST